MAVIRLLVLVCMFGGALLPQSAMGEPEEKKSPAAIASEVRRAHGSDDQGALTRLRGLEGVDPWLVVDVLMAEDAVDAARAFALTASKPDTRLLPAYVASYEASVDMAAARAVLAEASRVSRTSAARAVLVRLASMEELPDAFVRARLHAASARLMLALDDSPGSAKAWWAAGEAAGKVGWLVGAAQAFFESGRVALRTHDLERMVAAWSRWVEIEGRREDEVGCARSSACLANAYGSLGNYERALELYHVAERGYASLGRSHDVVRVLRNAGLTQDRRGAFRSARSLYARALKVLGARPPGADASRYPARRDLQLLLSHTHIELGAYESTRKLCEVLRKELEAVHSTGADDVRADLGRCLGELALAYDHLGEPDTALELLKSALALFVELGDQAKIVAALTNTAKIHLNAGRAGVARLLLERALKIALSLQDRWLEAHVRRKRTQVFLAEGDIAEALRENERGRIVANLIGSRLRSAEVEHDLAAIELARKNPRAAFAASKKAVLSLLPTLAGLAGEQGARAREGRRAYFERALAAAVAADMPADAAWALEAGRAGALLETLQGRERILSSSVSETLKEELEGSRRRERVAFARLQAALPRARLSDVRKLRRILDAARAEHQNAVEAVQEEAKDAAHLLFPDPVSLGDLQSVLSADEALVLFGSFGDEAVALVVRTAGARIARLGSRAVIEKAVGVALTALQDPDEPTEPSRAALEKLIAAPLKLKPGVRRVLVSPAGALFEMPLALVLRGRVVTYTSSGTIHRLLHGRERLKGTGILAFGGPDYAGTGLNPLRGAAEEAKAVGTVIVKGRKVTKAEVVRLLAEDKTWRSIHFACHGLVDRERPLLSALAFTPEGKGDDGRLTALDLMTMRVRSELVVLSACQTGQGRVYESEGLLGLVRYFMLAGSPRVLASLWKVDDEATRALMLRFYELWSPKDKGAKRHTAAEALRLAQAHIRGQKKWSHPYYWAAWVLWGLPD